jgi:hypothetical protein
MESFPVLSRAVNLIKKIASRYICVRGIPVGENDIPLNPRAWTKPLKPRIVVLRVSSKDRWGLHDA